MNSQFNLPLKYPILCMNGKGRRGGDMRLVVRLCRYKDAATLWMTTERGACNQLQTSPKHSPNLPGTKDNFGGVMGEGWQRCCCSLRRRSTIDSEMGGSWSLRPGYCGDTAPTTDHQMGRVKPCPILRDCRPAEASHGGRWHGQQRRIRAGDVLVVELT